LAIVWDVHLYKSTGEGRLKKQVFTYNSLNQFH
jgi:hypothetical protein